MALAGVVFNIQRFSLHDGPGIRTTVFLKGCPMHCFWCHNPEGRRPHPELRYSADRCIACGQCVVVCPNGAHEIHEEVHVYLRERCEATGRCVETCYSRALQLEGEMLTVPQVMNEVLRDKSFYESSGGGVTISGGEPAFNTEFSSALLHECKLHGLNTAIETCGECPWTSLEALLPVADVIMMDIKHMDPEKHRKVTGQSNDRILANARRLALTGKPIIFRTPVVETVNDSEAEIGDLARFIHDLIELRKQNGSIGSASGGIRYELLSFHKLASDKYLSLGLEYQASTIAPPTQARMRELADAARRQGIDVSVR